LTPGSRSSIFPMSGGHATRWYCHFICCSADLAGPLSNIRFDLRTDNLQRRQPQACTPVPVEGPLPWLPGICCWPLPLLEAVVQAGGLAVAGRCTCNHATVRLLASFMRGIKPHEAGTLCMKALAQTLANGSVHACERGGARQAGLCQKMFANMLRVCRRYSVAWPN
jgi:hypothetical protein